MLARLPKVPKGYAFTERLPGGSLQANSTHRLARTQSILRRLPVIVHFDWDTACRLYEAPHTRWDRIRVAGLVPDAGVCSSQTIFLYVVLPIFDARMARRVP